MESFEDTEDPFPIAKKSKKKQGDGFKGMGLSHSILKGIQKRGYKVPTPIQRKTIPVALQGRDMVAMARTGSGKTACFLIPLFEKLKGRVAKSGARAMILLPTRELALQTLGFIRDIGKFTDLKSCMISGGDNMESQFEAIHGHPDIIVATPGRFVHLCVEMELKLNEIEFVVFDEADRLFEMGFGEQLKDICARLPKGRQTLLFSATLPKSLVEFTRIGLSDPVLIRLDVESKLSEKLECNYIWCRQEEKTSVLLCLLRKLAEMHANRYEKPQIIIFAATRHHVEFINTILGLANITSTYLYSNLDPSARKISVGKFRNRLVQALVVTDIAARGIDIPEVGVVINYHFPATPKLFVHRVGRCARAGKSGEAYTFTTKEDIPYLLDLHLFLGKPFDPSQLGRVPADLLEEDQALLLEWHREKADLESMENVCNNGYSKYLKSKPGASNDSIKRSKQLALSVNTSHPIFGTDITKEGDDLLKRMKNYKPKATIFEISNFGVKEMKQKRSYHEGAIASHRKRGQNEPIPTAKSKRIKLRADDNYVPYLPEDHHSEFGLAVNNFEQAARKVGMDVMGDEEKHIQLQDRMKKWDSRKKKMVGQKTTQKKIRTESGVWISATYKTGKYKQWKDKSKADEQDDDDEEEGGARPDNRQLQIRGWKNAGPGKGKKVRSELKRPEQIHKVREKKLRAMEKSKKKKPKGKGKPRRK
ncbi:ATP-dependent RNA helicase DDX54 [Neocloeon triangulifer]|uniref:ATP-dependent RNA helicase DDX54 n=1 Tax=Neocloeon triangulifer TaxID=2078957 RepID=UPI00286F92BC|nr:ATP-dependent RNA helicase DDX54 [Neocloeon triangulifer]